MRIFSRYFAARFLGLFGAILTGSMLVIASIEILLNLDDMLRSGGGIYGALRYLVLRIPSYYWNGLVPISAAVAGFLSLGLAGHRFELLATRAGGIPVSRVATPVLLAAAGVAIFALGLDETWVVESSRIWTLQEKGGIEFRRGRLWYRQGQRIYNIGQPDLANREIQGIEIFELGPLGRLQQRIRAETAVLQAESIWQLRSVVVQDFDTSDPSAAPGIQRLETLDLELAPNLGDALLASDPSSLGARDLWKAIRNRSDDDEPDYPLRTALHLRLAQPATIGVLTLIGTCFGLRVERARSFGPPAFGVIAALGVFYALRSGIHILATGGVVPGSSIWLLLLGFAALGFVILARSPR